MGDETRIRPARPRDVDTAAELIVASGALSEMFDDRRVSLRVARRAFLTRTSAFGYARSVVAEQDARVVGCMARFACSGWRATRLRTGLSMAVGAGPMHLRGLIAEGRAVERGTPEIPGDALYVIALAVRSECRGRGIGARLIGVAVQDAHRLGVRAVALDTEPGNVDAIRFYRRHGFEIVDVASMDPSAPVRGVRLERPV
jgi:ribosomal protein S18 acetylase RimI-like enzyme